MEVSDFPSIDPNIDYEKVSQAHLVLDKVINKIGVQ